MGACCYLATEIGNSKFLATGAKAWTPRHDHFFRSHLLGHIFEIIIETVLLYFLCVFPFFRSDVLGEFQMFMVARYYLLNIFLEIYNFGFLLSKLTMKNVN